MPAAEGRGTDLAAADNFGVGGGGGGGSGEHTGFDREPTLLHWSETDAQSVKVATASNCVALCCVLTCLQTALMTPCNPRLARVLISHGASVDAVGVGMATPLHKAAERGDAELVQVLLDNRADMNAQQSLGQTPLHLASLGGW